MLGYTVKTPKKYHKAGKEIHEKNRYLNAYMSSKDEEYWISYNSALLISIVWFHLQYAFGCRGIRSLYNEFHQVLGKFFSTILKGN